MSKDDLPVYDESEQGLDQDFHEVPASTAKRRAAAARFDGGRASLIAKLQGDSEAPHRARSRAQQVAKIDEMSGPLRAVCYLRVSTEEQARVGGTAEGYSIPYQRRACLQKAEELGATVVQEYTDLGESAKSALRPGLQRMLKELSALGAHLVIVHKIDRLARNTRDDYEINAAIAAAGARLVSVSENIDDTPAGRLNYVIQAGVAQYHSDNLRQEVMKGLTTKVEGGGTPYRAPTGYLNKRRYDGMADVRWVEEDPERAPLLRWAFSEYAAGGWTVSRLRHALTAKGFRTRTTERMPGGPISISGLHNILRNPYYMGVVPYRGAYHDGQHPALVDPETWLQVQEVLASHNSAGEKDRKHPHYLKGSIWCGECGSRLIFSRSRGNGGTYDHFFCIGRRQRRTSCTRPVVHVAQVEAGVEDLYRRFRLSPARAEAIRTSVVIELHSERDQAKADQRRAASRLTTLANERKAALQAHYAGALPLDLLKQEMDRLTLEMAEAERESKAATGTVDQLNETLTAALRVASGCHQRYLVAPPHIRRQISQGFFTRLLIARDGSVERYELTEPFATLLQGTPGLSATSHVPDTHPPEDSKRSRPQAILRSIITESDIKRTSGDVSVTAGSNNTDLVAGVGFEPTTSGL